MIQKVFRINVRTFLIMKEKLNKQFKTHCISETQKKLRKIKKMETFSGKCIDLQVERRKPPNIQGGKKSGGHLKGK